MQLTDAIKKRRSIKKFSDKKPDWRKLVQAIDSTRYAPMAGGQFSLKFILVRDKEKIEKISEAAQQSVAKAPSMIIVLSDREKVKKLYDDKGKEFGAQQAGAAIQNILLVLADKGIGACWVGYFYDKQIREILKIPENMTIEAIIPTGFMPKNVALPRKKMPELENLLYFDEWKNKEMIRDTVINKNPKE